MQVVVIDSDGAEMDEDEEEEEEDSEEILDIPSPPVKEPTEKAKGKMPQRPPPPPLGDWGFEEIALPPGPTEAKKKKQRVAI